jgi:hypothetical protein
MQKRDESYSMIMDYLRTNQMVTFISSALPVTVYMFEQINVFPDNTHLPIDLKNYFFPNIYVNPTRYSMISA